jgi:hypothetical protein
LSDGIGSNRFQSPQYSLMALAAASNIPDQALADELCRPGKFLRNPSGDNRR